MAIICIQAVRASAEVVEVRSAAEILSTLDINVAVERDAVHGALRKRIAFAILSRSEAIHG
jgi:hypothetical protein